MSRDACGSLPHFDENGNLVKLETGAMKTLYSELVDAVVNEGLDLEIALQTVTSNVANILKIKRKGGITQGKDADIVLVNKKFGIEYYMAMGEVMVNKKQILKKGTYEK